MAPASARPSPGRNPTFSLNVAKQLSVRRTQAPPAVTTGFPGSFPFCTWTDPRLCAGHLGGTGGAVRSQFLPSGDF